MGAGRWQPPSPRTIFVLWLPVAGFGLLAWQQRWMSDDGYINLRVVWNVLHGNGPVFNAGERVEVATSPLWLGVLVLMRVLLWFVDPGWVAVLCGITLSMLGLGLAVAGARRWWASLDRVATLPIGAGLLVALPPLWDFASSGLETGLTFAWLGGCWWATARRLGRRDDPLPLDRPWWTCVLIGIGPLVRPDLALFSVTFAIAHVVTSTRGVKAAVRAGVLALTLPVAYQVFRMGYYGLVVPNTALAKEANRDLWDRGWFYLDTYLDSTALVVPLVLVVALFAVAAHRASPSSAHVVVAAAPMVGAVIHALYIVKVGGDFMHARLLLPATWALACPCAAIPTPTRRLLWAPVGVLAAWLVVTGGFRRFEGIPPGQGWPIWSERNNAVAWGGSDPVTLDDYGGAMPLLAVGYSGYPQAGTIGNVVTGEVAGAPRTVLAYGIIGVVGARFPEVRIADTLSLAEPIGAHLAPSGLRAAGHEKPVPWVWLVARFGRAPAGRYDARVAQEALACGDLAELVDTVEDPLTPARFLRNFFGSIDRSRLRIPRDPTAAREVFCDDD